MLVRFDSEGKEAEKMLISESVQWIGTSEECSLQSSAMDDVLLDPKHAKIEVKDRESWTIHDPGSTNGTWAMIQEEVITSSIEFQLGEQRFLARIP